MSQFFAGLMGVLLFCCWSDSEFSMFDYASLILCLAKLWWDYTVTRGRFEAGLC